MPGPFSVDLRRRVVAYHEKTGASREELAEIFGVGPATAYRWIVEAAAGKTAPGKAKGAVARISDAQLGSLRALVELRSDSTLQELCEAWERLHGVRVSVTTMHHALVDRLNITRKKRRSERPKR